MPRKANIENIAKRKEQIIKAAISAFARKGLKKTSMNDIVREAGISKGAIYWYFKSKDEIISELINAFFDPKEIEDLDKMLASGGALERINKLIEYSIQAIGKMKPFRPVIQEIYALAFRDQKIRKMARTSFEASAALIQKIIEDGVKQKEFRRTDPRKVTIAIIEVMEGATVLWFMGMIGDDFAERLHDGIDLIIDAIKVNK
ncbi:MAG: TetR/AcrR family transcriptional regulator [Bacteroidetes bacterium]|nr:TetR/AcrR family transcriptional regulator [Bacteroidota bacterium]